MSVTIQLPADLERQLEDAARLAGVDASEFAARVVEERLRAASPRPEDFRDLSESTLVQRIGEGLTPEEWDDYRRLLHRRQTELLTDEERPRLIAYTHRLEALSVRRLALLLELSRRRSKPLDEVMQELGVNPPPYE